MGLLCLRSSRATHGFHHEIWALHLSHQMVSSGLAMIGPWLHAKLQAIGVEMIDAPKLLWYKQ
jgi:hypothetical protein